MSCEKGLAHRSAVNDVGAHAREYLLSGGKLLRRSADHEGKFPGFGFHNTARHGGILENTVSGLMARTQMPK